MPRPLAVAAAWSWRLLVVLAAIAVGVWALTKVMVIVLPVIAALLGATVLGPLVHALRRRGWRPALATWAVVAGAAAAAGGIGYALYLQARDDAEAIDAGVMEGVDEVITWLVDGPLDLSREQIDAAVDRGREWLGDVLASGAVGGAVLAVEIVAGILLALVLLFFFLKDGDRMWAWLCRRLGAAAGVHVDAAGRRAWWALGGYVRGQAIVAAVDAVFIGLGIWLLGVPFVIPLTLLTFFAAFVPIAGAVAAGAVAVLVALAAEGFTTALILLGVVVLVQQLEGNILEPVVMARTVRLHPVVVLVAVGAGAALAGIVGAFLAVPVAAAATAVAGYAWRRVGPEIPQEAPVAEGSPPPSDRPAARRPG